MAILPGARLRDNGVFGTTTDNPLTAGATTFNSADLNDLDVVSGGHAMVTLDPLRQFGDPEIVMVTAHTAAATVATIQRGMYGTVARSHPQGTLWVHAATEEDFPLVVTSGTRPTDQYESQLIYETDTDFFMGFNGSAWGKLGSIVDTSPYSAHFQANPPACSVYHNVNQSIANNTETTVALNSERYDTNGMHDTAVSNERITFNTAGIYIVTFNWEFPTNGNGFRYGSIKLNGTAITIGFQSGDAEAVTSGRGDSIAITRKFIVGDFILCRVFQNTGGPLDLVGNSEYSPAFAATWVGIG